MSGRRVAALRREFKAKHSRAPVPAVVKKPNVEQFVAFTRNVLKTPAVLEKLKTLFKKKQDVARYDRAVALRTRYEFETVTPSEFRRYKRAHRAAIHARAVKPQMRKTA